MHEPIDDSDSERGPSRSQQRREALAVFEMAEALVALNPADVAKLPLSEELLALVLESQRITSHIARKRQVQFLAKQMRRREEELPAIEAALAHQEAGRRLDRAKLHQLEQWRDRLVAGGDEALEAFLRECPGADRQQLRNLQRRAHAEAKAGHAPTAARALFQIVREALS